MGFGGVAIAALYFVLRFGLAFSDGLGGCCNVVFLPFLLNTQHLYMSCIAQLVACMSSLRSWIYGLRYVLSLTQNKDENRFNRVGQCEGLSSWDRQQAVPTLEPIHIL